MKILLPLSAISSLVYSMPLTNDEIKSEVKVELKELMKSTGIKSHIEDMSQKVENLSFDDFYNKIADEVDAIEFNKLENQKDKIDELKSLREGHFFMILCIPKMDFFHRF